MSPIEAVTIQKAIDPAWCERCLINEDPSRQKTATVRAAEYSIIEKVTDDPSHATHMRYDICTPCFDEYWNNVMFTSLTSHIDDRLAELDADDFGQNPQPCARCNLPLADDQDRCEGCGLDQTVCTRCGSDQGPLTSSADELVCVRCIDRAFGE